MPKIKKPVESTRTRRQASKEALKQLQLLLDDEDDDAFVIPDDEDSKKDIRLEPPPPPPKKRAVSPLADTPPPKKKYKLSHRKSSDGNDRDVIVLKSISNSHYVPEENTLELECFIEELSEVQKERKRKAELEEKELQSKLNELLKSNKAEVVFTGGISSAVEVNELIANNGSKSIFNPNEIPKVGEMEPMAPTFQLVMDPRLGIIVGSVTKTTNPTPVVTKGKLQISSAVKAVATLPPSNSPPPTRRTRRSLVSTPPATLQARTNSTGPSRGNNMGVMTRGNSNTPRGVQQVGSASTRGTKTTPTLQTRNNKGTPQTGKRTLVSNPADRPKQVVDLTSEDTRSQADNKEMSFSKLQGKTFPSLVVVARPHLRVTDLSIDRGKLDSKVKSVLMHPPTKFTEWLIQQGLIRAEQKCPLHSNTQLKLGMYSDVAKFPFSGGYVWISECCPQRFISVFNGSIFEGSAHPPVVMLKLIYHWACQTSITNVTQWVKVDNLYIKGVYTWLRGVCTLAVQSQLHQLGGPGCRVEVGVISLGTTSQDGTQRQVKVEVLGVMESSTKYIRLRAVEPMPDGDKNFRKKFNKILEPILHWVHPGSTIVTDLTVDKLTLNQMGFTNVIQTTSNEYSHSNRTIMEYLRRIVPKMFQNALSLLSRQIIQQFLDELVWREWFGITAQKAFDNILAHLAEQTRSAQTPLIIKLNKVATNPFRSWGPTNQLLPNNAFGSATVSAQAATTSAAATVKAVSAVNPVKATLNSTPAKTQVGEVKKYGRGKKSASPQVQVVQERPNKPVSPDVPEQMVPLENYYYGTIESADPTPTKVTLNMKCPFCKSTFDNNILLQNHLFKHAHNVSNDAYLCRYCLTSVSTANELIFHVNKCHPGGTKFDLGFVCLICEMHYMNPFVLGKHMSKEHIPHELPYQCGSCSFRCSNHKQVIDHFYLRHDGGSTIQCPFCLKSTTVWSSGRNVSQNMHYFIQHLQKHQKKQFAKRCGKCNLWFVQKDVLKEHQQKMHISLRGKVGLIPNPSPRNGVMVPKSKMDKHPCDAEIINFSSLYYNISSSSVCKECNQAIVSSKHFPSFDNCQNPNCQYSTCCAIAMMTHNAKCKGLNAVIPPETLPFEMFCVCGFKDLDGNSMAKHLALCEKKSAYPSETEAKSATVMHSMLDILGLVRKPEETKNEKPSNNVDKIEEPTEIDEGSTKLPKLAGLPDEINILSDEEELEARNPSKTDGDNTETVTEKSDSAEKPSDNENILNEDSNQDEKVIDKNLDTTDTIDLDDDDVIMNDVSNTPPQGSPKEKLEENKEEDANDIDNSRTENKKTSDSSENIEKTTDIIDNSTAEIENAADVEENKEETEVIRREFEDKKSSSSENETDNTNLDKEQDDAAKNVDDIVEDKGCEHSDIKEEEHEQSDEKEDETGNLNERNEVDQKTGDIETDQHDEHKEETSSSEQILDDKTAEENIEEQNNEEDTVSEPEVAGLSNSEMTIPCVESAEDEDQNTVKEDILSVEIQEDSDTEEAELISSNEKKSEESPESIDETNIAENIDDHQELIEAAIEEENKEVDADNGSIKALDESASTQLIESIEHDEVIGNVDIPNQEREVNESENNTETEKNILVETPEKKEEESTLENETNETDVMDCEEITTSLVDKEEKDVVIDLKESSNNELSGKSEEVKENPLSNDVLSPAEKMTTNLNSIEESEKMEVD